MEKTLQQQIASAFFGLAVGDALGVPVEFNSRERIAANPVTEMIGYGTYHQPAGTWSDDSSMTFCLAESLCNGYNPEDMAWQFLAWYRQAFWTPHGNVFDIGNATAEALRRIETGTHPLQAGGTHDQSNGNGSLMRILPLVFYVQGMPSEARWKHVQQVSSITHRHIRSVVACYYYLEFARLLLRGKMPEAIYHQLQVEVPVELARQQVEPMEQRLFSRLLQENIANLPESQIESSGYVLHTLEASIWCLLTTRSYSEAVLKAVNLGLDTDTTGAVTGGLAGLYYGLDGIPNDWVNHLARSADITDLAKRLAAAM